MFCKDALRLIKFIIKRVTKGYSRGPKLEPCGTFSKGGLHFVYGFSPINVTIYVFLTPRFYLLKKMFLTISKILVLFLNIRQWKNFWKILIYKRVTQEYNRRPNVEPCGTIFVLHEFALCQFYNHLLFK